MSKHRITLTDGEIYVAAHLLRHFTDYVYGDDRPDHGLGMLQQYRDMHKSGEQEEIIADLISLFLKMNNMDRRIRF